MKPDLKMKPGKRKQKLTSVLGLTLDGSKLEGVVLKRVNGSLQRLQSFSVTLTLDPLTAAPELVAREIRNQLDTAGVREKNCVVGLPLRWVLTAQTELPPLPDADAASLLELEAEKNFHTDTAQLQIADSRCALAGDKKFVLLAGMPNTHIGSLQQILAAAKLKPVSFALGISALSLAERRAPARQVENEKNQRAELVLGVPNAALTLVIGETNVGLLVTAGGGVAALRALEGAVENEGGRRTLHANVVSREARVTLGQLPPELRGAVKNIRIFGPRDLAQPLADEMELKFEPMGLAVEIVSGYAPNEFGATLPPETSLSAAFSLAANVLAERSPVFEFLPPKLNPLAQLAKKYTSGKFGTVGAVAAGIAVILVLMFLVQQIQLWQVRSQWSRMAVKVADLQDIQGQIRFYRPWYDTSFTTLAILRQVTLAFPEDGSVTAKTIEIRDSGSTVICSGNTRDVASVLAMQARLRTQPGVSALKLPQIRGKSPMQFSFDFKYGNGGGQ